uniref:Major facilitator superfamily (MFS) profile domain-containing protein n=1 Tax=Ditylenchus dipsaci TaxID=166011 RepID=A0A915ENI8_9BILA
MASEDIRLQNAEKNDEKELLAPKQVKIIDPVEAQLSLGECKEQDPAMARIALKVYPRRWLILLIVALLNNTNTMTWIAFAPVANHVDSFYNHTNATNYFSIVYMLCTIPVGIFAMWAGRRFGLRWAILVAACSNGIGGLIKFSSSFLPPEYRFMVGITGQGIAALAYPFIMFLPTKVAAAWFPDNQRGIATTIGVMANPLGVLLANLVSPNVVNDPSHVIYLNAITALPAIIVCILAILIVNRSEPKLPPTISASQPHFEFLKGLQVCFTSREYILLLVVLGGGIGMFNCLYTIMQQLLCPSGYSNSFSGLCCALMIIGGVVGATVAGIFVDKTKKFEETIKVAMALAVVFGIAFLQLVLHRDLAALIMADCFLFGVFGLATYPVGLELSAECTYPVSETTSTGLIVLSGQIQSVIYLSLMTISSKDMTVSVIVMSFIAAALVLILVAFFHPKLRRSEAEKGLGVDSEKTANGMTLLEEADKEENA